MKHKSIGQFIFIVLMAGVVTDAAQSAEITVTPGRAEESVQSIRAFDLLAPEKGTLT